jgi:hypothetical protein
MGPTLTCPKLTVLLLARTLERFCRWISRKSNVSAMLGLRGDSTLDGEPPFDGSCDFHYSAGMILAAIQINNRPANLADREPMPKTPYPK